MVSPYRSKRARIWRNLMVGTLNHALDHRLIGLKEGENWGLEKEIGQTESGRPSDGCVLFDFEIAGLPVTAYLADVGFGELAVHVAVLPKHLPTASCLHASHMFYIGEAYASGWMERRLGPWIMRKGSPLFACRRNLTPLLAGLDIPAAGYKDHGKFII